MKLRCRIGFHRWTPWGPDLYISPSSYNIHSLINGGTIRIQNRNCKDCRKVEVRQIQPELDR